MIQIFCDLHRRPAKPVAYWDRPAQRWQMRWGGCCQVEVFEERIAKHEWVVPHPDWPDHLLDPVSATPQEIRGLGYDIDFMSLGRWRWDHLSAEEKAKILAAEDASGEAAQQAETGEREKP